MPKTFKYRLSKGAAGILVQIASLVEGRLTFEKNRAQSANSINKTVMTVSQEIQAELISNKGALRSRLRNFAAAAGKIVVDRFNFVSQSERRGDGSHE